MEIETGSGTLRWKKRKVALSLLVAACTLGLIAFFIFSFTSYYRQAVNRMAIYRMKASKTDGKGSDWSYDVLDGCDLSGMNLEKADFSDSWMQKTNFKGTNLTGAHLDYGYLREANFENATLNNATMQNAYLIHANLRNCRLRHANLVGASLVCIDLRGADLRGAYLGGAGLVDVDLRGADLTGAVLTEIRYDHKTKFPPGIKPKDHKMFLTEVREEEIPVRETPVWDWRK